MVVGVGGIETKIGVIVEMESGVTRIMKWRETENGTEKKNGRMTESGREITEIGTRTKSGTETAETGIEMENGKGIDDGGRSFVFPHLPPSPLLPPLPFSLFPPPPTHFFMNK